MSGSWSVYVHTSPSGKVYVGATSQTPHKRWGNGNRYSTHRRFYPAIQKYGWDNFKHEILFTNLAESEAKQKEVELIARYKSNDAEFGYNLTKGGNGTKGYVHTEESKTKISVSNMGKKKPHVGVARSAECREKMAKSHNKAVMQFTTNGAFICEYHSGKTAAEQSGARSANISACCLGKRKTANGFIWKFKNI